MTAFTCKKKFFIHEAIGATSFNEDYLVVDEAGTGVATFEEEITTNQKIAKAFVDKSFLPVTIIMKNDKGEKLLELHKPSSFFAHSFIARDADGKILCKIAQKCSLLKPEISVKDENGQPIGTITGDWKFRNFVFKDNRDEKVSSISHKILDVTKHLFTTADDYEIEMEKTDDAMALITVAATICIDFFYHE